MRSFHAFVSVQRVMFVVFATTAKEAGIITQEKLYRKR